MSQASNERLLRGGWAPALAGVVVAIAGGLFFAQAGGGDREVFLSLGFCLTAIGVLGIVAGGVALGISLARDPG